MTLIARLARDGEAIRCGRPVTGHCPGLLGRVSGVVSLAEGMTEVRDQGRSRQPPHFHLPPAARRRARHGQSPLHTRAAKRTPGLQDRSDLPAVFVVECPVCAQPNMVDAVALLAEALRRRGLQNPRGTL